MTKYPSSSLLLIFLWTVPVLTGCGAPDAGSPVADLPPSIAPSYIPLSAGNFLHGYQAAATVIAPGIAVTEAYNSNLVDPKRVIGRAVGFDLLFFRTDKNAVLTEAKPVPGMAVTAYGQGTGDQLRLGRGVIRSIQDCKGCRSSAYFVYEGDAGPGFGGGPVLDEQGKLVGITFGYKKTGSANNRMLYAYDMMRVHEELAKVQNVPIH